MLRVLFLLVGVSLLIVLAGCRKLPSSFDRQKPNPPAPRQTTTSPPATVDDDQATVRTVTQYLSALEAHDYAAAYDMLSRDSQARHSRADFEEQGKGMLPRYDLSTANATVTGDTAVVGVQFEEDPATHGFHLVRQGESWMIVYRGGKPGQPYPQD